MYENLELDPDLQILSMATGAFYGSGQNRARTPGLIWNKHVTHINNQKVLASLQVPTFHHKCITNRDLQFPS